MKRIIYILIFVVGISVLTACGTGNNPTNAPDNSDISKKVSADVADPKPQDQAVTKPKIPKPSEIDTENEVKSIIDTINQENSK